MTNAIQIKNPELFHSIMENREDWFQEFMDEPDPAHPGHTIVLKNVNELHLRYIYTMAVTRAVLETMHRMEEVTA